jgi:hypothetical protein
MCINRDRTRALSRPHRSCAILDGVESSFLPERPTHENARQCTCESRAVTRRTQGKDRQRSIGCSNATRLRIGGRGRAPTNTRERDLSGTVGLVASARGQGKPFDRSPHDAHVLGCVRGRAGVTLPDQLNTDHARIQEAGSIARNSLSVHLDNMNPKRGLDRDKCPMTSPARTRSLRRRRNRSVGQTST